jgi:hypothetical protein
MKIPSRTFTLLVKPIITLISTLTIRHSSFNILAGHELDNQGSMPDRNGGMFHFRTVYLASWPASNKALFATVKWLGCEADRSAMSSMQVENAWVSTFTGPYTFMHCLVKQADNITFFQGKMLCYMM